MIIPRDICQYSVLLQACHPFDYDDDTYRLMMILYPIPFDISYHSQIPFPPITIKIDMILFYHYHSITCHSDTSTVMIFHSDDSPFYWFILPLFIRYSFYHSLSVIIQKCPNPIQCACQCKYQLYSIHSIVFNDYSINHSVFCGKCQLSALFISASLSIINTILFSLFI